MAPDSHRRRGRALSAEDEEPPRGSLARFLMICFFTALVAVILGLYSIHSLFERRARSEAPQSDWSLSAVSDKLAVRPPGARNQLRVFFTKDGARLTPVSLPAKGPLLPQERGRQALEALFRGPSESLYASPIPPGVYLRAFYLREAEQRQAMEAVIDVSRDIAQKPLGGIGTELLCVYAIVNTALANCETADCARILVDGSPVKGVLWSHVDLSGPLLPGAMIVN